MPRSVPPTTQLPSASCGPPEGAHDGREGRDHVDEQAVGLAVGQASKAGRRAREREGRHADWRRRLEARASHGAARNSTTLDTWAPRLAVVLAVLQVAWLVVGLTIGLAVEQAVGLAVGGRDGRWAVTR